MNSVNHPAHYNVNGVEVIDVVEAYGLGFHLGNVVKYVLRAERKGGLEDLRKAQWYLNRIVAEMERDGANAKENTLGETPSGAGSNPASVVGGHHGKGNQ